MDGSSQDPWGQSLILSLFSSTANEGRNDYHPMFFTHDRAFEELFGICIQLLNKTWKEMRATAEDFNKVSVTSWLRGPWKELSHDSLWQLASAWGIPELENQPLLQCRVTMLGC